MEIVPPPPPPSPPPVSASPSQLAASVPSADQIVQRRAGVSQEPAAPTALFDPLLFIVVTASRPNGTDYSAALLTHLLSAFRLTDPSGGHGKLKVLLYDADPPEKRRPASYFASLPSAVEVHHASAAQLAELASVNDNPTFDKHHDPPARIRWRAKGSFDLLRVLELAHTHASLGWPYAVLLQDDVQLSSRFFPRLREILATPPLASSSLHPPSRSTWLAWALFHAAAFDHGKRYTHGAAYDFEACDQAVLYQTNQMAGLIDYVSNHWRQGQTKTDRQT